MGGSCGETSGAEEGGTALAIQSGECRCRARMRKLEAMRKQEASRRAWRLASSDDSGTGRTKRLRTLAEGLRVDEKCTVDHEA